MPATMTTASQPGTPNTPRTPSTPSFNTKSPTIKRILQESRELSLSPDPSLHAAPLETNLFEWHFTLLGPPSTPYSNGIYHGRIVLPPTYPLRPPSFRFLTPSGRFEVNREICLSISGHHEESWQPAWGIRTALCAIRAFMAGEANGQVGGLDMTETGRKRLAAESRRWRCVGCGGRTNEDVMKEVQEQCEMNGPHSAKEQIVPEELRLGYKDEIGGSQPGTPRTTPPTTNPPSPSEPPNLSSRLISASANQCVPSPNSPAHLLPPSLSLNPRTKPPPSPLRMSSTSIPPQSAASTPAPLTNTSTTVIPPSSTRDSPLPPITATIQTASGADSMGTGVQRGGVELIGAVRVSRDGEPVPGWIDKAIVGVVLGLVVMILRRMYS